MAHSSECTDQYAQKALDGADIVRDAMFRQLLLAEGCPDKLADLKVALLAAITSFVLCGVAPIISSFRISACLK